MQAIAASSVASATALGGSRQGAKTLWQGNALAKTDDFTEDRDCDIIDLPVRRICRLRFPDGWRSFALWVSLSRASRKRDARTGYSAHPASLHQYPAQSNRAGYPLVRKAILHLDDIAGPISPLTKSVSAVGNTTCSMPVLINH